MKGWNLVKILERFRHCAGVVLNWQIYGTSNIEHLPDSALIVENLLYRAADDYKGHNQVKTIAQTKYLKGFGRGPHVAKFISGMKPVKPNKEEFKGVYKDEIDVDLLRLNHYYTGTIKWFYQNKIPRRKKWGAKLNEENLNHFLNDYNQVYDDCMLRFVPELKKRMT